MADIIARMTNIGDTIANVGPTEKIEFNFAGLVPDNNSRHTGTNFRMVRDTNIHPNPRRQLDQIQDSLLGYLDVGISGYFVGHSIALGPRNLFNWSVSEAQTPTFPVGRFALELDSFSNGLLNVQPDTQPNTIGYVLYDVFVDDMEEPRDEVYFEAKMYRNGTIAEVP